ncbi:MAG: hypothetical protein NVS2B15_12770 [Pseudarthrobacter sp.]
MTYSALPRIDLYAQAASPEWWQILAALGPWVMLVAFGIVAILWWRAVRDGYEARERAGWWRRAEWALEAAADDDPRKQAVGVAALKLLNTDRLAGPEEARFNAAAWEPMLKDGPEAPDTQAPQQRAGER